MTGLICLLLAATAGLDYDATVPQLRFAASEIRKAFAGRAESVVEGAPGSPHIVLSIAGGPAQSYSIHREGAKYTVTGGDATGAMYGGLDIAEAVRTGTLGQAQSTERKPYIANRGIKFNIPLDARTPSYSDASDSAQQNIPEMWSFDFWREFLDEMARDRFNVLSLWSLHPFPSLVRAPEYPDIALDDVKRTTAPFDSTFSLSGSDMVRPDMLKKLETVKKMTIEEKIQFWRDVMQYAHDRGIEVYLFTWNVFVYGAEGKHGITPALDNPVTIDYFRKSVRETVLTYPLLAGIGITAGEQMKAKDLEKEKWLWAAYGEGIRDALKLQPGRKVRLIHRFHQTGLEPILSAWKEYPGTFDLSYKYSVAHMYSSTKPIFGEKTIRELPSNLRVWMTVRNDDIYNFRWGDAGYAREYIRNLPGPEKLAGFYMGPDGYTWGREFVSTEPEIPRELVIKKQWLSFMMWGRLSYEPSLPDSLFTRALAARFPGVDSDKLMAASTAASRIIPQITRFFWGDIDLKWFPEASLSHPKHKGYYTVRHFVDGDSMPGAGILNIRTYCDRLLAGQEMNGITPLQVADALENNASTTLRLVSGFGPQSGKELRLTLGDYQAMAHLGNYYASKIRGAVALALFERTGKTEKKQAAISDLESALRYWREYARVASGQYKPQLLTRVGYVDLNALTSKVEADIAIAEAASR